MSSNERKRWIIPLIVIIVLIVALAFFALSQSHILPAELATRAWAGVLAEEAQQLGECAECHEPSDLHSCDTCHGDHGEVVLSYVPFSSLLALVGDVPEPVYIPIQQLMPTSGGRQSHYTVQDLLAEYGVAAFSTVTLASNDGGFITLLEDQLTDRAYLLPYVDGIRFLCEDLHASTWLKGITRIIVVTDDTPLSINGEATSIGRVLLGRTTSITVEETSVMLQSDADGEIRSAMTASRVEGVLLEDLFDGQLPAQIRVLDESGQETILLSEELTDPILAQFHGETTLVLPDRARQQWITGIVVIEGVQ